MCVCLYMVLKTGFWFILKYSKTVFKLYHKLTKCIYILQKNSLTDKASCIANLQVDIIVDDHLDSQKPEDISDSCSKLFIYYSKFCS